MQLGCAFWLISSIDYYCNQAPLAAVVYMCVFGVFVCVLV